ncbi:hypothetical protein M6B38_301680 [Iris pallida]|uniref:Uncharacterized protein n=1 Tax=Iris pallida TaxID=29817 RepID=A0AAX6HQG1_IRIPA|nr:hypothetical protein M6B38_301680 [Iris pallida]
MHSHFFQFPLQSLEAPPQTSLSPNPTLTLIFCWTATVTTTTTKASFSAD